ncbi:MAG: MarR family transcriptional regulator [Clostridium sp.]|uniref:MarR family winged helix-turn-helix transcriptional regulator n=1 Tax=Clostridium sp. TaxID=1506 RepID=UPI0025C3BAE8|nr:MarR family transcriptional regulator [Clostridium sp.]MCH3965962.1 MarR family transcriptional regulator [Clostridium sp.]MCI1715950.1 MarR family transcriptional regulator [Clostridium sp.]MCI1800378.1 MarR family transcriptional regulator [Clostridium sp.]MCI1814127.1 MarR family transcriptional regulator [Clostridium sp.]MCI1871025.1 MarR family transcriptional regulator [Clostridium sp.]
MNNVQDAMYLLKIIKRVMRNVHKDVENHFKELNMTAPQVFVAITLIHNGKIKISDLSRKIGLSNSTVSGIVDRMEKQGWVSRIRSKDDRRVVYVDVTPEFMKIARSKHDEVYGTFQSMVDSATGEEMNVISRGLITLERVMDRQEIK